MTDVIEVESVSSLPFEEGDSWFFRVGKPVAKGNVTRITLQQDVAGEHGYLWRVCIWVEDLLIAEIPRNNVGIINYV